MEDKNIISISGLIVDATYDDEWFQEYIEKGLLTPHSKLKRDIDMADPSSPMLVKINSGGGSVFAAYEMVNDLVRWRNANGQTVRVEVGAMAASAASMIAISLGPVSAHENSMFMFHGASSGVAGGGEAMRDVADMLDKINAHIMQTLVNRYNMDPDVVKEWFAEGRMGWLNAEESKDIGIVDVIIPSAAQFVEIEKMSIDAMQSRGLQVAAMLEYNGEDTMKDIMNKLLAFVGIADEEPQVDEVEQKLAEIEAAQKKAQDEAYDAGLAANVDRQVADIKADYEAKAAQAEADVKAAQEARDKADAETAKAIAEMKVAQDRLGQLSNGLKTDGEDAEATDYWEVVADYMKDGMSKNAAMLKAQRDYPDLHRQMLKQV